MTKDPCRLVVALERDHVLEHVKGRRRPDCQTTDAMASVACCLKVE